MEKKQILREVGIFLRDLSASSQYVELSEETRRRFLSLPNDSSTMEDPGQGDKFSKPGPPPPRYEPQIKEPQMRSTHHVRDAAHPSGWENSDSLETLRQKICSCMACRLGATRKNFVFGEGSPDAELMFIGEGPGRDEDLQGRPFVGRAGQLLDKMISAMQFRREDVYIGNIVKCRPPENRVPERDEADACMPYLMKQIALVRPKAIVLLGATPARFLLGVKGINEVRGKWQRIEGISTMPTYHPAFLLRNPSAKKTVWEDLKLVMALLGKTPKPQ